MTNEPTIDQTIEFIKVAHAGQLDRGGQPYWLHPVSVMNRLGPNATHHEKLAALLHDVLEDTSYTADDLLLMDYPHEVVHAVQLVTRPNDSVVSYLDWIRVIAAIGNKIAIRVKIADNEDNMDPERLARLPPDDKKLAAHVRQYATSLSILRGVAL